MSRRRTNRATPLNVEIDRHGARSHNPFKTAGRAYRVPTGRPRERADKDCQSRTAVRRRRVARLIFKRAETLHKQGLPHPKVLDQIAVSTVHLQEMYEHEHGQRPSRDTLAADLEAILGKPTGKLKIAYSDHVHDTVQANTYSLRHVHITLGRLGRKLARDLHDLVLVQRV